MCAVRIEESYSVRTAVCLPGFIPIIPLIMTPTTNKKLKGAVFRVAIESH